MIQCLLIADDLTGACDAAAPFAARGLRTVVPLRGAPGDAEIVALSTDSRDVEPAEARRRLRELASEVRRLAPRVLFKKIDSTLRGNTGHEIVASVDAFACEAVLVNPAFPAMGRTVTDGHLLSADIRIRIAEYLETHGAETDRVLLRDAACDADLDAIAEELLSSSRPVLWAGSAGLAGALARRIGGCDAGRPARPAAGPVLFCIGSDHPVTVEQLRRLAARGRDPILHIPRGACDVRERFAGCRPAGIVLSGGDTASLVCRALEVERIDIAGEFSPGVPIGALRGGSFDGVAVVTKSGGFGAPDTLLDIADYFHA